MKKLFILLLTLFMLSSVYSVEVTDSTGFTYDQSSTVPANQLRGVAFEVNADLTLLEVIKSSSDNSNIAYIYNESGLVLLDSASFSGDIASFNLSLSQGDNIVVQTTNTGTSFNLQFTAGGQTYPVAGTNINFTKGYSLGSPDTDQAFSVVSIKTEADPLTPTISTNLSGTYNIENLTGSATTTSNVNMTFYQNGIQIGQVNDTNSTTYTLTNLNLGENNISLKSEDSQGIKWNNFTLTYQPYQYFYFNDSNGNPIYNFSLDGTTYEYYAAIHTNTLNYGNNNLTFSKLGYTDSIISFNVTDITTQLNETYIATSARIVLNIKDKITGNLITGTNFSTEFVASVGAVEYTTTGVVNITNTLFQSETYLVVVTNTNYQTETLTFNFNNQEELELNVYMIEANNTNLGVVNIAPVTSFGQGLVGATVKALQWDSSTSTYVQVSQGVTGSDGVGTLNIILNDKIYIFSATYGGISSNSSSEIISTVENGKTITLVLSGTSAEYDYILNNVIATVTESFNNVTNISTLTFTWEDLDGISQNVCLNSYRVITTSETQLTESCTSGASGIFILDFYVNSSYMTVLKGEIKLNNGAYVTIDSFRHYPPTSISEILKNLGLNLVIVPLLFLAAIAIGMISQNTYIGTALLFIFGGFSLTLAPDILTKGIVAFLGFLSYITILYGVKPR